MPLIKPSCVRDLKARIDIVDVVGRVANLKRAGGRFKGLCPFHTEKTPSFHVNPERGLYKCFGCGKGGDIFAFVQETEGLTFMEAAETLGRRFGVPIEYEEGAGPTTAERSLRQELYDLHEAAADYFRQQFLAPSPTGDFMRTYWTQSRRFPAEVAEDFKIGAVASDDTGLAALAMRKHFSEDALRQSGLFFVRDGAALTLGSLRPRFRGRLMIPIRDHQGRVVAFTARQTQLTPADDPAAEAKYVNSPETPIFTKGHLLFNLDRARTAARDDHPFVLVEGQLDAIRCWHAGLKTAIAPQGTALTESQLLLLRRYQPRLECLFDSDSAGQKASLRLVPLALKTDIEVRFLALAGDSKVDPDVLFAERGLAAYDDLRTHAQSAMTFLCRATLPEPAKAGPEEKTRAAREVYAIIAEATTQVARGAFLEEAASRLGLPVAAVQRDFADYWHRRQQRGPSPAEAAQAEAAANAAGDPSARAAIPPEQHLLLLLLHHEELGPLLNQMLPHEWVDTSLAAGVLLNRFLGEFHEHSWPGRDHLDPLLETQAERSLVAQILFDNPGIDDPLKVAAEGVRNLRARALEPELRKIELALNGTPADSNFDAISLLKRRTEIARQLREPIVFPALG